MSRFAHHASAHAAEAGFELVQDRYVAVPAVLWGLLIGIVVAVTAARPLPVPASDAGQVLLAEPAAITVLGA